MLRILIADGTPAAMQAERETFGIPSNASLFEDALRSQQPHIGCSSINVADALCCTDQQPGAVTPRSDILREANVHRPPKLEHAVQRGDSNGHLGHLPASGP